MHRIDTPTAQKDKFGAGKNGFTRGNPQTGTPATDLDDDYFDMLQEELAGVVEASGVNLEKSKHNQLLTALKALLLSRAHPFADIKADGAAAIAEALSNLGISDEITRAAAAIVHSTDTVTDVNNAPKNSSSFAYGSAANSPGFNATILTVSSLNDTFEMQIAIGYNPVKVAFRAQNGDTSVWQSWLILGAAASKGVGKAAGNLIQVEGAHCMQMPKRLVIAI